MTKKPRSHLTTISTTGLQDEAPVVREGDEFGDTPTTLDIRRATPATPLYARVTARLSPVDDDAGGAVRIALLDSPGRRTAVTDPAAIESGTGVRTTGWQRVRPAFNGGTATVQASNARVTAVTFELGVRNDI
ncbi:hypothetical protein [Natrialba asiatica]|uniref:Uncharacterized protein n=1 Tax=Natrialba asiatica (strain ATCC 700177 / DSM 12278 / JCM 9576 / FERM P-10747 / NBRC 102637 / 172P1) TaxID=29540 RepID=M0B4Z0_NATA1|nr:hypothetical protein [Natrialba asiatica]ELZ05966.1 hypothetical protein C481_00490 [Natrialba asiatica DSM 12278]